MENATEGGTGPVPTDHLSPMPKIHEGRLLTVLVAAMFLVGTNTNMMAPLLLDLAREFDTSVGRMGQLAAAQALPWAILAPFMGVLSDRYGRRPVLALGLSVLGGATLLSALAWSYWSLLVFRMIGGIGGATTGPLIMSSGSDFFPALRRGRALGMILAGISLSTVAGVPLLAMAAAYAGWRLAFLGMGSLLVLLGFAVWLVLPRVRPAAAHSSYLSGIVSALRERSTAVLLAANVMERVSFAAITTYLAAFLMQSYGLRLDEVAPLLSAIAAGALLGSVLGGRLADRGRQRLVYFGFMAITAFLAFPLFAITPGILLTALLASGYAVVNSLARPAWLWMLSRVPEEKRGATMGFTATSNQVGQAIGASVGGMLIGLGSYSPVGWLAAAASLSAAAACLVGARRK